jgi:hypothetical protein
MAASMVGIESALNFFMNIILLCYSTRSEIFSVATFPKDLFGTSVGVL